MLEQTNAKGEREDLEFNTGQQIMDYYYLKYEHDHSFVIGDNRLQHNVEVMIGNQTLYCSFHDSRNAENGCEHIRFIKMLNKIKA
jgi:hypothetical protein